MSTACRFFLLGSCNKGDSCTFSHDENAPRERPKPRGGADGDRWDRNDNRGGNDRGRGRGRGGFDRDRDRDRDNNDRNGSERPRGGYDRNRGESDRGGRGGFDRGGDRGGFDRGGDRGGDRGRGGNDRPRYDRNDRNDRSDRSDRNDRGNDRSDRDKPRNDFKPPGDRDRDNRRDFQQNNDRRPPNYENEPARQQRPPFVRQEYNNNNDQPYRQPYKKPYNNSEIPQSTPTQQVISQPKLTIQQVQSIKDPQKLFEYKFDQFIHFLPLIEAQQCRLLGVVGSRGFQFFPIQGPTLIDYSQKRDLPLCMDGFEIVKGWIQEIQGDIILMACCRKTSGNMMRSVVIYPNLIQSQEFVVVSDVCLKDINYCYFHSEQQIVYTFCGDGQIRIFDYYNNCQLQAFMEMGQCIECAQLTYKQNEDIYFLIGGKQGLLALYSNGIVEQIQHNVQQQSLVQICCDYNTRRFYLLFWDSLKNQSQVYILSGNKQVIGPVYTMPEFKLTSIAQVMTYEVNNLLVCGNEMGTVEFLIENKNEQTTNGSTFSKVSHLPKLQSDAIKIPKVKDVMIVELRNQNQVVEKFILIGRENDTQTISNVEIYNLLPQDY